MMANNIFNRVFTAREKGLVLALIVIVLGTLYYFGIYQNVVHQKAENEAALAEIEDQILIQTTQASLLLNMQAELESLGSLDDLPIVPIYDNVGNELQELNTILAAANSYNLSLSTPVKTGETVRREVSISFTTADYESALGILGQLQNGRYYSQIKEANLTGKVLANGSIESVNATLKVVYFETTVGATNLNGLIDANASSTSKTSSSS